MVVDHAGGSARIDHNAGKFRYKCQHGDPFQLKSTMDLLRERNAVDSQGFIEDKVLFEATAQHIYPDAVQRSWRAFHGLFRHVPDVFLSIEDGYMAGSPFMSSLVSLKAAHGNLRTSSTLGFAASMAGELPPSIRMADLRAALQAIGVPIANPK
jgi:hypothetical protein